VGVTHLSSHPTLHFIKAKPAYFFFSQHQEHFHMDILDFRTVDFVQIDISQPRFSDVLESEIGKGGLIAITVGNYDQTYYVNIDPATGAWSWTSPVPLADGEYNVSFQAIDQTGNLSEPTLITMIIDTTPPVAPTLLNMYDDQGSITGSFDAGKVTDDRRPKLTGIAEKGTMVYLKEGNTVIGSALADKTTGLWTLEPNRDLSDGQHDLTLVSSETFAGKVRTSAPSDVFSIIIGDDAPVPVPGGEALITHALDNVGSATGELKHGALTDDTTPELHGTAEAGSTVRIQYRSGNGSWIDGGNAQVSGSNWSWTPAPALGEGSWTFRANGGSGWSDEFSLDIDLTPGSEITITHAWDDFGANHGLLSSGAITDDRTPTLHGRAESNSVVYIHYRNLLGAWDLLDTVTAGADGHWEYESPRLSPGSYEFQAGASLVRNPSTPPFELKIAADFIPTIDYAWDDVGELAQVLNNGVTDDTRPTLTGSAESNSTVVITYLNYSGPVFNSTTVQVGENGRWSWTPDFPLSADLTTPAAWEFYVNALGAKTLSEAFKLTIRSDSAHYLEDFQSETARTFDLNTPTQYLKHFKIDMYNKGAGSYLSGMGTKYHDSTSAPSTSLLLGKTGLKITLNDNLQAKNITFKMGDLTTWGGTPELITIKYYDINDIEIGTSSISASSTGQNGSIQFSQDMNNGKLWHSFTIYHESAGSNQGVWVWIDNIEFDAVNGLNSLNTESDTFAPDHSLGLITLDESHELVLNKASLLTQGVPDLFIADGKTQLMINGKAGDSISLEDILQEGANKGKWIKQSGTVTVAGVQYHVYSNGDAELLVQDGVSVKQSEVNAKIEIQDFRTVDYVQIDGSLPRFFDVYESEIGKGGLVAISIGNYDQTYYVNIDPATGAWSWTSPVPLADGEYNVALQAIDHAGNVSDPTLINIIIDNTPPVAPTLINMFDDQGSVTGSFDAGKVTDDRRPKLTGIAEKGTMVYLKEGNTVIGSALADKSTGLWTLEPNRDLSDGRHDLTLVSSETFAKKVRTGEPSDVFSIIIGDDAPVPVPGGEALITHALDNVGSATGELKHGALTDDTTPELYGTVDAGSTVRIQYRSANGSWIEGANAQVNGSNWSWTPSPALGEGNWEFRANGGSGWGDEFALSIDLTLAGRTEITHAWDDFGVDKGRVENGERTDDLTPTLYGRAEANRLIYIHYRAPGGSWELLDSVVTAADGIWKSDPGRFVQGNYEFQTTLTSVADPNASVFTLLLGDNIVPAIETIYETIGTVTNIILEGGSTEDRTPEFSGSGVAGSTVYLDLTNTKTNTTVTYTAVVNGLGKWHVIASSDLVFGDYEVKAKNGALGEYSSSSHLKIYGSNIEDFQKYYTGSINSFKADYFLVEALIYGSQYRPKIQDGMLNISHGTFHNPANTGARVTFDESLHKLKFDVSAYAGVGSSSITMKLYFDDGTTQQIKLTNNTTDLVRIGSTSWASYTYDNDTKSITSVEFTLSGNPGAYTSAWYFDNFIMSSSPSVKLADNEKFVLAEDDLLLTTIAVSTELDATYEVHVNHHDELNNLNTLLASKSSISAINLENMEQSLVSLSLKDMMNNAQENLFIDSDSKQFMIKGEGGNVIHIDHILGYEYKLQNWSNASGQVEIAGVQFNVYHNESLDAEILVQQGLKVDFS
jgi:ABC-type uncharacterized transport system substrate-binding protein